MPQKALAKIPGQWLRQASPNPARGRAAAATFWPRQTDDAVVQSSLSPKLS
jgi:hypothetical protein